MAKMGKNSALAAHIDAAALKKKLGSGNIGAWSLAFVDGRGMLELSPSLLALLGLPAEEDGIGWDDFLATLVYPEDEPQLRQAMLACCERLENTLRMACRVWSKASSTWNRMFIFGSADVLDRDAGRITLSGGLQNLQECCPACAAPGEAGLAGGGRAAAPDPADREEEGYRALAFAYNKASSQLEMITEGIGLSTWDWHVSTGVVTYSDNFFRSLGYEPEEGKHTTSFWASIVHPDDRTMNLKMLNEHIAGSRPKLENELRLRHKDGHYVWMYNFGRIIERNEAGEPVRVAGGFLNIDERKRFEQGQQESLMAIAERKDILEREVAERTNLLNTIYGHLDDVLRVTGLSGGPLPERLALDLSSWDGGEHTLPSQRFAEQLEQAFTLITDKMWWYKSIIDSIPFPISVRDMEDRWTYLNEPALDFFGGTAVEQMLGRAGSDLTNESCSLDFLKKGETSFTFYHPMQKRHYRGQIFYLYNAEQQAIGRIEAMQDVTEMHEADERIRIMLDSSPLACNFWDSNLNNVDCNLAAARLFNCTSKQDYLDSFFQLSPERQPSGELSKDRAHHYISTAFSAGYVRFDWMHQFKDGTPVPCEITLVRVERANEYIVVGYTRDLTELKIKDAELDKERRLLQKVMDSSPVCFVILVDGVVQFATPYTKSFFGIREGSYLADFYADEEKRTAFFHELEYSGAINWRLVTVQAADGTAKEMLANAFLAEYYGEPCVMSWFMDITEMREKERQLRLARDAAEQSASAKSDFLANMSHEIRTPMNAILGMTRLVLETPLDARQKDFLQKAEFSARALLRILNDILDFSKIEAGKLEIEEVEFSLPSVVRGALELFEESAGEKGLLLECKLDPAVPEMLVGDPLRLSQIITNLVGNAIKFTTQGSVSLHIALAGRAGEEGLIRFSVVDTGIGLSKEQQAGLFMAFSQADSSTTRRYGGTGLGLAISKRLVELMHGTISCASSPGEGSTFTFTAVFGIASRSLSNMDVTASQPEADRKEARPEDKVAHLRGLRLLVAEDNDINQIIAEELLEGAGFVVDLAVNGKEAIEKIEANSYALVFMDIQMPEMDGLTAVSHIRENPRFDSLPIVAMTAHAMVGDKEKSLAVGMNDHITKPLDAAEVFSTIVKWLSPAAPKQAGLGRIAPAGRDVAGYAAHPHTEEEMYLGAPPPLVSPDLTMDEEYVGRLTALDALPGINAAEGLAFTLGNKARYYKLLVAFAGDAPALAEAIGTAIMTGDTHIVKNLAHECALSSTNLGLTSIAQAAQAIERATHSNGYPALFGLLDDFEKAVKQLVQAMAVVGDGGGPELP